MTSNNEKLILEEQKVLSYLGFEHLRLVLHQK